MSDLSKPQEDPGAEAERTALLDRLQKLMDVPGISQDVEAEMASIYRRLARLTPPAEGVDWVALSLNHTWEGLAKQAGVRR